MEWDVIDSGSSMEAGTMRMNLRQSMPAQMYRANPTEAVKYHLRDLREQAYQQGYSIRSMEVSIYLFDTEEDAVYFLDDYMFHHGQKHHLHDLIMAFLQPPVFERAIVDIEAEVIPMQVEFRTFGHDKPTLEKV